MDTAQIIERLAAEGYEVTISSWPVQSGSRTSVTVYNAGSAYTGIGPTLEFALQDLNYEAFFQEPALQQANGERT